MSSTSRRNSRPCSRSRPATAASSTSVTRRRLHAEDVDSPVSSSSARFTSPRIGLLATLGHKSEKVTCISHTHIQSKVIKSANVLTQIWNFFARVELRQACSARSGGRPPPGHRSGPLRRAAARGHLPRREGRQEGTGGCPLQQTVS